MLRLRCEPNPATTIVLEGIRVPGGQIPNWWDENHVHHSMGEPVDAFGDVDLFVPAGQAPPPYCATRDVSGVDRWLPLHSQREVRVRVTFEEYVGGLNPDRTWPVISLNTDSRFSYRVRLDEILVGDPRPFEVRDQVTLQVHSPSRDLRMDDPVGMSLVLTLRETVRPGGDRDYSLLHVEWP